jgi:hypothetical protein
MVRGPWASPKHDFLARHEHEPSTSFSGSGRHEPTVGLVLGCDLSPPCWPSTTRNRAAQCGPLGWHEAHQPKWLSGPTTYKSGVPSPKP